MKYLLYGIVQQDLAGYVPRPGICLLTAHGLAAAVSAGEEMTAAPSVGSLLAYERVVEAIHARQAVIPLRYGCVMESDSAVIRLLENHRPEYETLLTRLRGMAEMGIRVLSPARAAVLPAFPSSPGAAYLTSLRKRYDSAMALGPEESQLADRIAGLFSGCSTERRSEVSLSSQGRLVSLYFLIPKTCVEQFRQRARQICLPGSAKVLWSGPWPPYNFADL
jgi:hypothetical protein